MTEATCAHCRAEFVPKREGDGFCRKPRCQDARRKGLPPYEPRDRGKWRAREYRRSVKAFVRAGGSLTWLAKKTGIEREDLEGLLDGRFHWLSAGAARALEAHVRVPASVEYAQLVLGSIPIEALRPYLDEVIREHGATNAGGAVGMTARRIHAIGEQEAVTTEIAERIVLGTAGPAAFSDDALLRRFWWTALPSATLFGSHYKRSHERAKRVRAARELVAA